MLTRITKEQMVSQKKAETGLEITQVQHKVLSAFYDGDACTQTMGGMDLKNLQPVTKIKNRSGTVILTTGTSINRLVEVSSIIPKNPQGSGLTREVDMVMTIKKLSKAITGHNTTVKKFGLTVEVDTSDKIIRCHHTLDAKEEAIKERMCREMGGKMVPGGASTRCSIDNLFRQFCESMQGNYNPTGMTCDVSDLYVNTTGDTLIGPLKGVNMVASGTDNGASPCPADHQDYTCGTLPDRIFCDNGVGKVRKWKELSNQTVSGKTCYKCGWDPPKNAPAGAVTCP